MNSQRDASPFSAIAADPLASLRVDATAIADLAFGSFSRTVLTDGADRHLAMLDTESLELDLNDPAQRRFGDYELQELIGEGGMGVVYRAHQASLDREVAVKLLAAGPWASKGFIERFRREAQNAARMQHPNIVAIYEVGSAEELHFFSMRLIRGGSLADLLKREGKLAPLRAAQLLRVIAEAVDYAHRLGVLHLDLKPANVLLDDNGSPHVADFGLARRLEQGLAADNNEVSGTPSYMAPEQCTAGAQKITPATDIWGLGAVLYELVTGRPPYQGASPQETLKLVVEGKLSNPREHRKDLPLDLAAIIEKCLAGKVADRYATARALADDLAAFTEGRPVKARPLNALQRIGRFGKREPELAAMAVLAFAALLIGITATTMQWRRADTNAARAQANAVQADANALRAEVNAAQSSEHLWAGRRDTALRLMQDGKGFEALVPLLANIEEQEKAGKIDPASIERREFGMIESQGVTLIDRMIIPDAPPLAAGLSPDGSLLAIALGDFSVRWYDTATLSERGRVDVSGLPTSDGEERVPRVLRFVDDHRLRVTLEWFDYMISPSDDNTYLIDLDHAKIIDFPPQFADPANAVFSADAQHALLRNRRSAVQLWQVQPWKPLSALSPLTQQFRASSTSTLLDREAHFIADKGDDLDGYYLSFRDPRDLSVFKPVVGLQSPILAWTENSSGSLLAVGDSRGRVYLVDTVTRALRQLPTPAGREVTWLSFSEDDAWLAAVRWDGAAFAFDVASGDPLNAGQMQNEFEPHEVAISHRERLLVAAGLGETALWRLPDQGPNALEATRLIAAPTRAPRAGTNSLAISLQARLLASTSIDGEVRLWRLPGAGLSFPAGKQEVRENVFPDNLYFDGQHLPDVAWNRLRIVSTQGEPPTPWLTLPQPIAYSELVDAGKTLLATSGHEMYVFDAPALQRRFAPVDLPANPQRCIVSADGRIAVLSFGGNDSRGFKEHLIAYDLNSGSQLALAHVHGPLRQFQLSAEGSRLLTTGPATGATEVFDSANLQRIGAYPHDPARPVTWAAFVPGTDSLWLLARDAEDTAANDADLIEWNARTGTIGERRHLPGAFPIGVTTLAGKPFVATRERDLFDPGASDEKSSAPMRHGEATAVFATSHDGRLLAHVFGRDVQLYDTATLAAVGPPLRSNMNSVLIPYQLAFSPDDSQLVAPGWLLWPLAADARRSTELRAQVALLNPTGDGQHVLELPGATEHEHLRRADPGPPPALEVRPAPATARIVEGQPIPARDPAASPMLLDLTSIYNLPCFLAKDMMSSVQGYMGRCFGVARIDGVDYDMRASVELHNSRTATGVRVPAVPIAAFHVLLRAPLATPSEEAQDYAYLRLHYRDGSSAQLPIRTQRDVPGLSDHDAPTPIGWVRGDFLRLIGLSRQELTSNPRLPNPHPEKLIATLDLETPPTSWANPTFFAITAEPVTAVGKSGSKTGTSVEPKTDSR